MNHNKDEIESLLIEKIAGTISPLDNIWIEELLKSDAAVSNQWMLLQQKLNSGKAKNYIDSLDSGEHWMVLQGKLSANKGLNGTAKIRWFSIAAVLLITLVSVVYYNLYYNKDQGPKSPAGLTAMGVRIDVASGKSFDLSSHKKGTVNLGNVKVSQVQNKIEYVPSGNKVEWMTLSVPAKFDYQITLNDGTQVWLNSRSKLKFPSVFSTTLREVYLEGEGFFKVAKNKESPFIIHAATSTIQVLGTTFNVNAYNSQKVTTSLVEGKVLLQSGNLSHILKPGHKAYTDLNGYTDELFNEQTEVSWISGEENFNNMSLKDISQILKRWYDVEVMIDDPGISNSKISGVIYKDKPIQFFLGSLETSSNIKTEIKGNVVRIFR
jgi:transmembrane sensor